MASELKGEGTGEVRGEKLLKKRVLRNRQSSAAKSGKRKGVDRGSS